MNKVVLIGEDHHNLLGLVRDFGVNGISPIGIVIGVSSDLLFSSKSRYWGKVWIVDTVEAAIELLKNKFIDKIEPAVVIASSDETAAALDTYYNELKDGFIIPGFQTGGRVKELMNKESQVQYAHEIGVEMLPSETVPLDRTYKLSETYPVIVKPVASVEGKKTDIKICYTAQEEKKSVQELISAGYRRVLRQLYLQNRTEYVLTGAVMPIFHKCNFALVKNIRQWPMRFGTGSFSEFVTDPTMLAFCDQVMDRVQKSGYCGLIDIEFFKTPVGKIYLNEFNWRSSGRNFVSLYTGVHSAYWWYCAVTGNKYDDKQRISTKSGWTMNESIDLRHVVCGNVTWKQWLKDRKKCNSFALWDASDLKPTFLQYLHLVKELLKRRRV